MYLTQNIFTCMAFQLTCCLFLFVSRGFKVIRLDRQILGMKPPSLVHKQQHLSKPNKMNLRYCCFKSLIIIFLNLNNGNSSVYEFLQKKKKSQLKSSEFIKINKNNSIAQTKKSLFEQQNCNFLLVLPKTLSLAVLSTQRWVLVTHDYN